MHWRPDKDRELLLAWSLALKQKIIESHANKTPANHHGSKHIAHVFTQTRTAGPPRRADPAASPTAQSWRVSRTNWASLHREQWRPEVVPLSRRRGGRRAASGQSVKGLPGVILKILPPTSQQLPQDLLGSGPGAEVKKGAALLQQCSWTRRHG